MYTYSPHNAHIGSWKTPCYAKCALVETDSYVLYKYISSPFYEIRLSNKAVVSSGFLRLSGGFISKFALFESEESYSD